MLPWTVLDTADLPDGSGTLRLKQRGSEFSIMLGSNELMNSRLSGSEEALARLDKGSLDFVAQRAEGVTYARKIDKSETHVDWNRPSHEVHNHIRGLSHFPGAWSEIEIAGRPERLRLLRSTLSDGAGEPGGILDGQLTVACRTGAIRLVEVQRAGGKPAAAQVFLHGAKVEEGMKFS